MPSSSSDPDLSDASTRCILPTTLQDHHGPDLSAMSASSSRITTAVRPTADADQHLLVLDLPAGLGGADIAAAGRIVLEHRRQWAAPSAAGDSGSGGGGALLDAPRWLVYFNGRRAGYAARRGSPSDAEGWVLEKLRAVTAGAGKLPGRGGVEYLRGRRPIIMGIEVASTSKHEEAKHLPVGKINETDLLAPSQRDAST
ncbi:hypothetical protein EJB05_08395, partial [Eragrostis curvula]